MRCKGCDLVTRALEFRSPERVPVVFTPPRHSDVMYAWVSECHTKRYWEMSGVDEWGCTWTSIDKTIGQVTGHPLPSWEKLDTYSWPDFSDAAHYDTARKAVADADGRYVLAELPAGFFERSKWLRGDTELLLDLLAEPQRVTDLLDRLAETYVGIIRRLARVGVHGVILPDDWGMQSGLWINPVLWRRMFKQRYAALVQVAHSEGIHFFLHSCGYIWDIIEDLVEIGVDCLQFDQPSLMGVEALGKQFGGRICFYCPVDIQTIMVSGTPEDVRCAARELMFRLGNYGGGFIARESPSSDALNQRKENIDAMCQTFLKHGHYPLAL